MKKINYFTAIILALSLILTGCGRTSSVEEIIMQESQDIAVSTVRLDANLNIERKSDRFVIYPDGCKNNPFTILILSNFYEETPFEIPKLTLESELPESQQKFLETAKNIVVEYIETSNYIEEEHKPLCKDSVMNVTIHYGQFEEEEFQTSAMITFGTEIYVNKEFEDYFSEYFYIHELIHVVSNVTNSGSKYEYSSYRGSRLNEVITDLISVKLAEKNRIYGYELSGYKDYYLYGYYAIAKFDLLKAYYYSDQYEEIVSNQFDSYILLLDYFEDTENNKIVLEYIRNEWFK